MTAVTRTAPTRPTPTTESSSLRIRPARRSDAALIAEAVRSSAEWYRPLLDEKDMDEHEVDAAWAERNLERRDFYIGEAQGQADGDDSRQPVGILSLQYFGDFAYLGYIYLFTEHVGRGFGQRLIRFAETTARRRGMKGMILIAHPEATWAKRAYLKYGFRIIESERQRILDWQDGVLRPYYEEGFELYLYDLETRRESRRSSVLDLQHVGRRRLQRDGLRRQTVSA